MKKTKKEPVEGTIIDILGVETKVGDIVVYPSSGSIIRLAVVTKLNPKTARVQDSPDCFKNVQNNWFTNVTKLFRDDLLKYLKSHTYVVTTHLNLRKETIDEEN